MADGAVRSYFVDITGSSAGLVKAAGEGEAAGASLESRMGTVAGSMGGVGTAAKTHLGGTATQQAALLDRAVAQVDSRIKSVIGSAVSLGAQFLTMGGIVGGIGAIAVGTKDAISFQQALTLIQTQAHDTTDNLQQLGSAFEAMGPKVGQTPEQLANAFFHLASAGYTGTTALNMLQQSAELAAVGQSDLETTTNAVVGVMKSAVPGVTSASDAVGVLNAIVGSGNMHMQDLVDAMSGGLLPVAGTFGVSIQSVGAALSFMTDQGIPAADAGTKLRMSLSLMAAPSAQATKLLTDAGLSAQDAATQTSAMQQAFEAAHVTTTQMATDLQKPDGFVVALQDLKDHMDAAGVSAQEQDAVISRAFGGGRSGAAIIDMYHNLDQVKTKFDQINTAAGQFPKDWAQQQKTGAQALADVKSAAEVALTSLGTGLLPYLTQLGQWVASHSTDIEHFGATLGQDVGTAAKDVGGFIANDLWPPLHTVGDFIGSHLQAFKDLGLALAALYGAKKVGGLLGGIKDDLSTVLGLGGKLTGGGITSSIAPVHVWVDNMGGGMGTAGTAAAGADGAAATVAGATVGGAVLAGGALALAGITAPKLPSDITSVFNELTADAKTKGAQISLSLDVLGGELSAAGAKGSDLSGLAGSLVSLYQQHKISTAQDLQQLIGDWNSVSSHMTMSSQATQEFSDLWNAGVHTNADMQRDMGLWRDYTNTYGSQATGHEADIADLLAHGVTDVTKIHATLDGAASNAAGIPDAASALGQDIWKAAGAAVTLASDLTGAWGNLASDIGKVDNAAKSADLTIPAPKATGGLVAAAAGGPEGSRVMVGEHGPELVDLPAGSYVHPNFGGVGFGQMASPGGGVGGSGGGDIHIDTVNISGVQDIESLVDQIRRVANRRVYNQGVGTFIGSR